MCRTHSAMQSLAHLPQFQDDQTLVCTAPPASPATLEFKLKVVPNDEIVDNGLTYMYYRKWLLLSLSVSAYLSCSVRVCYVSLFACLCSVVRVFCLSVCIPLLRAYVYVSLCVC